MLDIHNSRVLDVTCNDVRGHVFQSWRGVALQVRREDASHGIDHLYGLLPAYFVSSRIPCLMVTSFSRSKLNSDCLYTAGKTVVRIYRWNLRVG